LQNKIEAPTPKKQRKFRKATALSDISVNAPRLRAPRPKKASIAETPLKRPSASMQNRGPPGRPLMHGPILNPLANFGQRFVPSTEEDEEFRMTVGDMAKKRPFSIFQEAPEISPGRTSQVLRLFINLQHVGRTESPLEDHRYLVSLLFYTEFTY
jgi:hypothetical protein